MSQHTPVGRVPWNKGRLIGPKPPLKPKHVWGIRIRLQLADATRDLAMFDLAIDSKLRGCDLARLKIGDVALNGSVRSRATVVQQKTGHPVQFEITEQTRESVGRWVRLRSGRSTDYLFPSRVRPDRPISTRQYARLVDRWVGEIDLDPATYGTHSMRRTKATLIYRRTGNLRAIQLLLGHTKLESTVRYLGIELADALALAEQAEI
ncbi:tyrosine-type recombinase/integrase [Azospirillum soli]|uniref:tyrosine-type recombinase/integrase n=1 Tax=Azospirillum soli TaxID=1304799 RepID=UPI001AEA4EF6|nr:tyrosine-type recombinase/integrase [Azospirillum soli]MBP2310721.1 integrase [Azospirillum soli]